VNESDKHSSLIQKQLNLGLQKNLILAQVVNFEKKFCVNEVGDFEKLFFCVNDVAEE
jgi:hypothetical protein